MQHERRHTGAPRGEMSQLIEAINADGALANHLAAASRWAAQPGSSALTGAGGAVAAPSPHHDAVTSSAGHSSEGNAESEAGAGAEVGWERPAEGEQPDDDEGRLPRELMLASGAFDEQRYQQYQQQVR